MTTSFASLKLQLKAITPMLIWFVGPLCVLLGLGVLAASIRGIRFGVLSGDVANVLKARFYIGAFSQLGFLLWAAAATVCFFAFGVCRTQGVNTSLTRFLLASGLLTSYLCLDDMFQIHEVIMPFYVGISERGFLLVVYAVSFAYLYRFRRTILQNDYLLLVFAICMFGIHEVTDSLDWSDLMEDGPKFLGLGLWLAFYSSVSAKAVIALFKRG